MPRSRRQARPRPTSAVDIADRLHSAAIHLLRRLRVEDAAAGVSAPQLSALSVIVFRGPIAMGDLAAAEQVKPPTITRLVHELERRALVTRTSDREDARVTRIAATAKGAALLAEGRARRIEHLAVAIRAFTPAERRALARAVELIEKTGRREDGKPSA